MEQDPTTYEFATYVVPAWLRTRVTLRDQQMEVRCPMVWAPIPLNRVLYRFSLARITDVQTEQVQNPVSLAVGMAALVVGPVVALGWARAGAILTGVTVGVAVIVAAMVIAVAGARTRIWVRTENDGRVWFDVASTERHDAAQFGHWLMHEARLAAGRREAEEPAPR